MYLRVARIREELNKDVAVPLVVGEIVSQSSANCLIVLFNLPICLYIICARCQMFHA